MSITELSPKELQQWQKNEQAFFLLDVREDAEVQLVSLPNHHHIAMKFIPIHLNNIPDDKPIVIYCHHGVRSLQVAHFLENAGFDSLYNLTGGIDAWATQINDGTMHY